VDSELQRRLESLLQAAGLPCPEYELPVRLPSGRTVYPDVAFPAHLLAVEADSYVHHSTLTDWSYDHVRNNELAAMGWRVLHVTHEQLRLDPRGVVDQIARALAVVEVRRISRAERPSASYPPASVPPGRRVSSGWPP
jgi:hypothetical protein